MKARVMNVHRLRAADVEALVMLGTTDLSPTVPGRKAWLAGASRLKDVAKAAVRWVIHTIYRLTTGRNASRS